MIKLSNQSIAVDIKSDIKLVESKLNNEKINFLDPSIERKRKLTEKNFQYMKSNKFPLPSEVEISESGICNRKCSFCPRSAPDFKDIKNL